MDTSELNDLAWELAEHGRATLTVAELNVVFVRLGVGEYPAAIGTVLKALIRGGGPPLPTQLLSRLVRLQQVGFLGSDLEDAIASVGRIGMHHPGAGQ